jgi:hypothetical protein
MHFESFHELSKSNESYWSTIIAPYLAESIFTSSKVQYEDPSEIPEDVSSFETKLTTLLYEEMSNNSNPNEIKRIYLWFGTREQAKSCNASGIDKFNGKYVVIQSTIPDHDVEFYDRHEIIQDTDPSIGGVYFDKRINKILSSSPRGVKDLTDETRVHLVQDAVEQFVEVLMNKVEKKQINIIAIYETKRTMRRGNSTLFEDSNILLGNEKQIRDLGEEDDGSDASGDDYDSDYLSGSDESDESDESSTASSTNDHAEATDFLMRKLHNESDESLSESSEYDESHDLLFNEDEDNDSYVYNEKVDEVITIHNKLMPYLHDIEKHKESIIPLLQELHQIGYIVDEPSESDESSNKNDSESIEKDMSGPELLSKLLHMSIQPKTIDTSNRVEEIFEEVD